MFIEYVDNTAGNGVGLEIYNPSGDTVDLALEGISIRFFNHTDACSASCPPAIDNPLAGLIPPGGTFVVGNSSYCNSCTDSCDFAFSYSGLNGNDAVLLTRADTAIDMIGIPCFCIGMNCESYTVGGMINALCRQNLARCLDNPTYYSDSNGVYVSGDTTTSWPNDRITNVEGWMVSNAQCIVKGHTAQPCVILPVASLQAWPRMENCRSLISWTAEKADSFQVMKLEASGRQMVRAGVVYPQPGESQYNFLVRHSENSEYQVIAWANGEITVQSNLVKPQPLSGNCQWQAANLYPNPARDVLTVRLAESGPLTAMFYDLRGKLMLTLREHSEFSIHTLSVRELPEGWYCYKLIYGQNQPQTGKLIVYRK